MIRDLNKTRNERRVFFTTPQRKDGGQEATVTSIPVQQPVTRKGSKCACLTFIMTYFDQTVSCKTQKRTGKRK